MTLFFGCMLQKFVGCGLGIDARSHEVMPAVAQVTDDLGGESLVEQFDHGIAVGSVPFRYGAALHVSARALAQRFDIGKKRLLWLLIVHCASCRQFRPNAWLRNFKVASGFFGDEAI